MAEGEICTCASCGFQWSWGRDGSHVCSMILRSERDRLRSALQAAERERDEARDEVMREHLKYPSREEMVATIRRYASERDAARLEAGRLAQELVEVTGKLALAEVKVGRLDVRRLEMRQLLRRMVKYVREDKAVTPGLTRLSRLVEKVDDYLKRTGEPTDILRGEAPEPKEVTGG